MNLFPIDPAARAIIRSLETQPERWVDTTYQLCLGQPDGATVKLWKSPDLCRVTIVEPSVDVSYRSRRAIWKAYQRWEGQKADTAEQQNREVLMAALEGEP